MKHKDFERLVAYEMDALPEAVRRQIANVAILVAELADDETLDLVGVDDPYDLLGFYDGVPLTARTTHYGLVPPDTIYLYRQAILAACASDAEVRAQVRATLRHELAHYFGIDDDRLHELGAY